MHPFWSHTATLIATLTTAATSETGTTDSNATAAAGTATASNGTMVTGIDGAAGVGPRTDDAARPQPWIRRYAPRRNQVELGAYAGALLPSRQHELYQEDPAQPDGGYERLVSGAGTAGARLGYMPLRWLAFEAEAGASPTRTVSGARATLWHARGSVVAQLGRWSVVPFALVGMGALGVSSNAPAGLGRDVDAAVHFGGGLKLDMNQRFVVRLDVRDTVAARRGVENGVAHNGEILLGAAVRMGRRPAEARPAEPRDRDLDGFLDPVDACPDRPGVAPDGCPVLDSDADGFLDPDDRCPDVAGVEPDGCPVLDRDHDGFFDDVDACIEEPGVAPDGCPLRDRDGDGFLDPDDRCPDVPETRNGFEDVDGCPDEIPDEVKQFTGVIEGIYFDLDKSTIRPRSRPVLDRAVEVLLQHESIRIEISGHTDSSGSYAHNLELSTRRALAVRDYVVDRGIAADRVSTRGAGPDEPIADNTSKRGREQNRRIEFRIDTR